MGQPETKKGKYIKEIVSYVDDNFEIKPQFIGWRSFFERNSVGLFSTFSFLIMVILLVLLVNNLSKELTSNLPSMKTETGLALSLSLAASLIAIMNLTIGLLNMTKPAFINKDLVTSNYDKMKHDFPNNLAILKAVVIMKSSHPEIALKQLLDSHKEIFEEKNLFGILYLGRTQFVGYSPSNFN